MAEFGGEPLGAGEVDELWSSAECTLWIPSLILTSLANIVLLAAVLDRYLKHPSLNLPRDVRDARLGRLHQCSGTKRWREDENGERVNLGSFSLGLYTRLTPLLADAWKKLGLVSEETAKTMVSNQKVGKTQHDPRRRLAREGIPDLSTVGDVTEPDSSRDAIMLPATTPAQSISPLKRKGRLDAHMDMTQDQLRQKMIKLSPISSAAGSVSPTKPTTPTAPSEKPSPASARSIATTGRALSGSFFISGEPATNSPAQSPTKTFRVPSCSPSACNSTLNSSESINVVKSAETPVRRPGAPTPSRWAGANLSTPLPLVTAHPTTPGSNLASPDIVKLMNSIPRPVETPIGTPSHWERDPQSFEFDSRSGTDTANRKDNQMSFISAAHYTAASGNEQGQHLVERKRRKSEPLLQKHFMKMKQTRRQSMGPSKLQALAEGEPFIFEAGPEQTELNLDGAMKATILVPQTNISTQKSPSSEVRGAKADITAPLTSFFTDRTPPSKRRDPTTPFHDRNTYDIDVRQNLDIFGAKTPTRASQKPVSKTPEISENSIAVQRLVSMVEDRCEGRAKVMAAEENGKFVVRFKLPMKYACLFPESQGPDESLFTSTPSAVSSSPRIKFWAAPIAPPSKTRGSLSLESSPAQFVPSPSVQSAAAKSSPRGAVSQTSDNIHMERVEITDVKGKRDILRQSLTNNRPTTEPLSPQAAPVYDATLTPAFLSPTVGSEQTLVVGDFDMTANQAIPTPRTQAIARSSPVVHTPSQLRTPQNPQTGAQDQYLEAPSSGLISDISFEPTFQTPTHDHLVFSPTEPKLEAVSNSTTQAASFVEAGSTSMKETTQTPTIARARASPPLNTSFTPVNKPVTQSREATPIASIDLNESARPGQLKTTPRETHAVKMEEASTTAARDHQQQHDDETREYLSAFLKRSTKPKRPWTTDAGSPIAHTPVRLPLGVKSPNRAGESPDKTKRKREVDEPEIPPAKQDPVAKKPRVGPKVGRPRSSAQTGPKLLVQKASKASQKACEQKEGDDDDDEPFVRRSSRLNIKESKIALPTAIRLNRTGAAKDNWPTLNSAIRNEQAELTRQTNSNTRKNRGKAESVHQILAKVSSDESSGDDGDKIKNDSRTSEHAKTVAWKDPIESHQVQKPTRGRPPGQKTRTLALAEEKKTTKTAPKSRIAKPSAAKLGRTNNGTPAKRVTRSRALGGA